MHACARLRTPACARAGEIFQEQLDFLSTTPTYTLAEHAGMMQRLAEKAGLHGWQSMLRSKAQQAELEDQVRACARVCVCKCVRVYGIRQVCGERTLIARRHAHRGCSSLTSRFLRHSRPMS
ncbi:hypothetical protein EON68_05100 [archaeon]|nr:MAG: hypothetical protein EON68_05100 [archaeon]